MGRCERESPKRTISAGGWFGPLQMVSEPGTRRANEEAEPRRGGHEAVCQQGCWGPEGVDWGGPTSIGEGNSTSEDAGSQKGVDCEIPRRLKRRMKILFKGVKTSPELMRFKNLKGKV